MHYFKVLKPKIYFLKYKSLTFVETGETKISISQSSVTGNKSSLNQNLLNCDLKISPLTTTTLSNNTANQYPKKS